MVAILTVHFCPPGVVLLTTDSLGRRNTVLNALSDTILQLLSIMCSNCENLWSKTLFSET